jgi:peptidyl-prolyl cis-trans isomerase C
MARHKETAMSGCPDSAGSYLTIKLASELYGKSPDALDASERSRVAAVAQRQTEIERHILATVEAGGVVLPAASVAAALAEIRRRYASDDEFQQDLARAGLTLDSLRVAIERDLKVEAVLEQVAGRSEPASATDIEIFFLQHAEKFVKPETRTLRHILVTINEALAGNERPAALAKIELVHERLLKAPERFAEQALKHSECPTAMNGGVLGELPRGKLYPEIDAVAFALMAGQISDIVESPIGFHVVLCESIQAERQVALDEAKERIRTHLEGNRRSALQKAWVAGLLRASQAQRA